ncbi:MAG TPA: deoxyribose-phosphate aldolase [Paludibacter sp.]|jgi:deoxyribose-phosphate aldolase|nr:MAG: Deoxyribose-phosphate aldolase [Bacteroidetes bacterium ADurb.Bin174]HQB27509.1 deoxyribose-phosphate aldolase [Paludibacter sp.]
MNNIYEELFTQYHCAALNDRQVRQEVEQLLHTHLSSNLNTEVYKFCLGCMDLTSLNSTDNDVQIVKMVQKVNRMPKIFPEAPLPAGICVYPNFISTVKNTLQVDVKTVAVSGGFPASQTFAEIKTAETAMAVMEGADEIDVVMPVGDFLSGEYEKVRGELEEMKASCRKAPLKVILESGILPSTSEIKKASVLAMSSGADFIKTSTGKATVSATPEATYVMCQAIKAWHAKTREKVGIKVAGGIVTAEDAVTYYTIVKQILGTGWLDKKYFRIGASRLANNLLNEIVGKETRYF